MKFGFLTLLALVAAPAVAQEEERRERKGDHQERDHGQVLHERHIGRGGSDARRYEAARHEELHKKLAEVHRVEARKTKGDGAIYQLKQLHRKIEEAEGGRGEEFRKDGERRKDGEPPRKDGERRKDG
jgi:hypothetical protein